MYIYIYMCVCVFVCVSAFLQKLEKKIWRFMGCVGAIELGICIQYGWYHVNDRVGNMLIIELVLCR